MKPDASYLKAYSRRNAGVEMALLGEGMTDMTTAEIKPIACMPQESTPFLRSTRTHTSPAQMKS